MYVPSMSDCVPDELLRYEANELTLGFEYARKFAVTVDVAVLPLASVTVNVYVFAPDESMTDVFAVELVPD